MNLMDMLKDQVTSSLAKQASGFLGESESAVSGALGSAFPAILGSMIDKGSSQKGAEGIMGMIKGLDMDMLGDMGSLFGGGASSVNGLLNSGGGILDMLLGDKMGGIVDMIAKVSGMKSGSTSSLLKMAAPFLLGMIGKQIKGKGVSGLMDLLMGQKEHVAKAMPSGMGSLLGLANFGDIAGGVKNMAGAATGAAAGAARGATNVAGNAARGAANVAGNAAGAATGAAKSGLGWLKGAIPLLLLAAAAWYFLMGPGASKVADAANAAVETTANAAGAVADGAANAAGAVADGAANAAGAVADMATEAFGQVDEAAKSALDKMTFTAGSAGSQMMDYIKGGFKGDGTFQFNNLNFATGSAELSGDSAKEVDNLAAILKAYPGVKIEVQGHTDNTGDAGKNKTLSQMRAVAVQARLMGKGGIAADRIKAVGYGDAMPKADNGTAEGRAQNRRIEVKLVK